MRKIIIFLMMALLLAGAADAKTPKRKAKKRQTTTATTSSRSKRVVTPISAPQREITDEMLDRADSRWGRKNYQEALEGSTSDMEQIARFWSLGDFGYKDEHEALRWYYLAAKAGDGYACYLVGEAYMDPRYFDYAVKENCFEAAKWFAKARALGNSDADFDLGLMLKYGDITNEEFRLANEWAGNDVQEAKSDAIAAHDEVSARVASEGQRKPYYGTWTSARGATFTISEGPYVDLRGAGKFKGEWLSDGSLYVNFIDNYEITLKYSNGYLYDRDGRMHWRVPTIADR